MAIELSEDDKKIITKIALALWLESSDEVKAMTDEERSAAWAIAKPVERPKVRKAYQRLLRQGMTFSM